MDKITFLAALSEKMTKFSLSDEEINICIAKVKEYISPMSDENFAKECPNANDLDKFADSVYQKYLEAKSEKESSAVTAETVTETAEEELPKAANKPSEEESDDPGEDPDDILEILAREAEEERANQEKLVELKQRAIERAKAENDEILAKDDNRNTEETSKEKSDLMTVFEDDDNDPVVEVVDASKRPDIAFEESEAIREASREENDEDFIEEDDNAFLIDDKTLKKPGDNKAEDRPGKKEKIQGTPIFWTVFILLLPIICPILIALSALFIAAYVAVTAIIIALCVAVIGVVAAGTVIALVGIIYGAIQTFKVAPIGMFELGIGITTGGATMFLSVLMYNIAIRFTPMLYTCLTKLAKLIVKQLLKLFIKAKKECGR